MKNKYKIAFGIASLIAIPAMVNYYMAKMFNFPLNSKYKEYIYSWRFGDIHYTKCGKGSPMLLIHGISIGAGKHEWDSVTGSLSKHHTVYAIDLLGFGSSQKPGISYSAYLYTSLINDFINNVIGEPVDIIANGNSADFAVLAHAFKPDNYKKMLLISPTGLNGTEISSKRKILNPVIEFPLYGTFIYNILSSRLGIMHFLSKYGFYDIKNMNKATINKYFKSAHYGARDNKYPIAAFFSGLLNANIKERLDNIDIPVHIVWGAENWLNPVNNAYSLKNEDIKISVFQSSRLFPHTDEPVKFIRLAGEFFS